MKSSKYRFIIPNLFTLFSLITAIFSLTLILKDQFVAGSWLIALSMFFDGLDGKLARCLNASSKFGAMFDSVADFVAFGIVPAILAYRVVLHQLGFTGILLSSFFIGAGAFRLVRFTLQNLDVGVKHNFIGLPIPAAACLISAYIIFNYYKWQMVLSVDLFAITIFLASVLMVSKIEYIALEKKKKLTKESRLFIVLALISAIIAFKFSYLIFGAWILIYILYGIIRQITIMLRKNEDSQVSIAVD